jgi:hypothetical protein
MLTLDILASSFFAPRKAEILAQVKQGNSKVSNSIMRTNMAKK